VDKNVDKWIKMWISGQIVDKNVEMWIKCG
jgi:hypothetical protein